MWHCSLLFFFFPASTRKCAEPGRHDAQLDPLPLLRLLRWTVRLLQDIAHIGVAALLRDPNPTREGGDEAALLHDRGTPRDIPEPPPGAAADDNERGVREAHEGTVRRGRADGGRERRQGVVGVGEGGDGRG